MGKTETEWLPQASLQWGTSKTEVEFICKLLAHLWSGLGARPGPLRQPQTNSAGFALGRPDLVGSCSADSCCVSSLATLYPNAQFVSRCLQACNFMISSLEPIPGPPMRRAWILTYRLDAHYYYYHHFQLIIIISIMIIIIIIIYSL